MHETRRRGWPTVWKLTKILLVAVVPPVLFAAALVPPLPNAITQGTTIVKSRPWAVVLGKAMFWDQQAGSDGNACASCHFHAGADTRLTNQLTPGLLDITHGPDGDFAFGSERSDTNQVLSGRMPSGAIAGSNYKLKPTDMPLHQLLDEADRNSPIRTTTNDRISSQGSFDADFRSLSPLAGNPDQCGGADDSVFHAGTFAARQVEPRNTPTTINAAFNHRNFWDGRANNLFNGVGVFGLRDINGDPNLRLVILDGNGVPQLGYLQLENASLASQAVGPPLSGKEMSCANRRFPDVGRKLLGTRPLKLQRVDRTDSVLGRYMDPSGNGLAGLYSYQTLIKNAFDPKYWAAPGKYKIVNGQLRLDPAGHTQMELNFSMFWGVAIMLYEATLVSDQSEFDTLIATGRLIIPPPGFVGCFPGGPVDPLLLRGCNIFATAPFLPPFLDGTRPITGSGCVFCHANNDGFLFTEAGFQEGSSFNAFLTVPDVNGVIDLRDNGFANIGLRPVFSDPMSGGTDPYGNPLSLGRQLWTNNVLDPFLADAIANNAVPAPGSFAKLEVDGSSKVPTMRNVALTPPYFSWGGYPSLRQVLKTYNRGVNRRDITGPGSLELHGNLCASGDDSGSGPDGNQPYPVTHPDCNTNTSGLIVPLGLLDCDSNGVPNPACATFGKTVATDDIAALERFLKSLTDPRVQCDKAPFDHPALRIPNGHITYHANLNNQADDVSFILPAVGAAGYAPSSGFCIPNVGNLFAPGMQSRSGGAKVPLAP